MKLPKYIKDKIIRIVQHNNAITALMNEITSWNKKLDEPVKALREGWYWDMYFRGSPKTINEKEIEAVILTALTDIIVEPECKEIPKTITLSELRKQKIKKRKV